MASTPLTWVLIALVAGIAVIGMAVTARTTFYSSPGNELIFVNTSYNSEYENAYANISSQSGDIESFGTQSETSLVQIGLLTVASIFTTAIIGLQALSSLFGIIPIINTIFQVISTGPFAFTLLITAITAMIAIYITMKIIQALRATVVEP